MTLSQPIDANPSAATLNPVSAGSTLFLRPAPDRPSSIPGSSPRLAPSSSQSPSPSPSRQRSPVLVGASSRSGSVAGAPSGQELVEIPRFKKRELLLAIVGGHSLGPKIAWIGLWVAWLSNGLLSLVRLTLCVQLTQAVLRCECHVHDRSVGPLTSRTSSKLTRRGDAQCTPQVE